MELSRVLFDFLVRDQPNRSPFRNNQPKTTARDADLFQPLRDIKFEQVSLQLLKCDFLRLVVSFKVEFYPLVNDILAPDGQFQI